MTPLHWAAFNNDTAVIKFLLERNAQMTYSFDDQCALDIAGRLKNKGVILF